MRRTSCRVCKTPYPRRKRYQYGANRCQVCIKRRRREHYAIERRRRRLLGIPSEGLPPCVYAHGMRFLGQYWTYIGGERRLIGCGLHATAERAREAVIRKQKAIPVIRKKRTHRTFMQIRMGIELPQEWIAA